MSLPCRRCAATNVDGNRFCSACGEPITAPVPDASDLAVPRPASSVTNGAAVDHEDRGGRAGTGGSPVATATVATVSCPYCLSLLDDEGVACPACGTLHHGDCWDENGRQCAVTGCGAQHAAPPPQASPVAQEDRCRGCGAALREGCRFCQKCGAMVMASALPVVAPAPHAPAPYAPAAPTVPIAVTTPPAQHAPAAPTAPTAVTIPAPQYAPTAPVAVGPPQAPATVYGPPAAPAPPTRGPFATPWVIAVVVLLVAITGVSVALAVSKTSNSQPNAATSNSSSPTTTASTAPVSTPTTASLGLLPAVSGPQMRQDVQAVLTRFHQDLVNGSYQDAWYLLSARKQEQTLSKTGFAPWATAQASLGRYLDPTGLQVAIQSVDPNTGEAVVLVTGMRWSKPNAKCTQWSGLTWMKYESGAWRYDPGYSTTPEREAQWLPRYSELLGAGC